MSAQIPSTPSTPNNPGRPVVFTERTFMPGDGTELTTLAYARAVMPTAAPRPQRPVILPWLDWLPGVMMLGSALAVLVFS